MIEIAMSKLKKKFLTLKNFLWLFIMLASMGILMSFLNHLVLN